MPTCSIVILSILAITVLIITALGSAPRQGHDKWQAVLAIPVVLLIAGLMFWLTTTFTSDNSQSRTNLISFIQVTVALMVSLTYCVQFDANARTKWLGLVLIAFGLAMALFQFPNVQVQGSETFFKYLNFWSMITLGFASGMLANYKTQPPA